MSTLLTYTPGGPWPGSIVKLVWCGSTSLLHAARQGQRDTAERLALWLSNTRADPRCTPSLARTIDRALEIARRHLGGGPTLTPLQPDDGEVA